MQTILKCVHYCRYFIQMLAELWCSFQLWRAEGLERIRWENPGEIWYWVDFSSDLASENWSDLRTYLTIQERNLRAIGAVSQKWVSESRGFGSHTSQYVVFYEPKRHLYFLNFVLNYDLLSLFCKDKKSSLTVSQTLKLSRNTLHMEYSAGSVAVILFSAEYGLQYSEKRYNF